MSYDHILRSTLPLFIPDQVAFPLWHLALPPIPAPTFGVCMPAVGSIVTVTRSGLTI